MPLIRLQCHEGIDASQALYDWDFPRQILHLRAVEAVDGADGTGSLAEVEASLFDERFLARPTDPAGPARGARRPPRRRDRPRRRRVRGLPARGPLDVAGEHPRARDGQRRDAAARRPHLQPHPRGARRPQAALPLPLARAPLSRAGARDRAHAARPRSPRRWPSRSSAPSTPSATTPSCIKPPGVAETLDWARALHELGVRELDTASAAASLGVAVKYREDGDRVRASLDRILGR